MTDTTVPSRDALFRACYARALRNRARSIVEGLRAELAAAEEELRRTEQMHAECQAQFPEELKTP